MLLGIWFLTKVQSTYIKESLEAENYLQGRPPIQSGSSLEVHPILLARPRPNLP